MVISSTMAPDASSVMVGSFLRMALANMLCLMTYWFKGMCPNCQAPYGSLPIFQNFTL